MELEKYNAESFVISSEHPAPIEEILRKRGVSSSLSLTRMGVLYIIAALCQCVWPVFVLRHYDIAIKYAALPVLGWAMAAIWIAMFWCIPHLIYIGVQMIRLSRHPEVTLIQ